MHTYACSGPQTFDVKVAVENETEGPMGTVIASKDGDGYNEFEKYVTKTVTGTCADYLNVQGLSKTSSSIAARCAGKISRTKRKGGLMGLDELSIECLQTALEDELPECGPGEIKKPAPTSYKLVDGTTVREQTCLREVDGFTAFT